MLGAAGKRCIIQSFNFGCAGVVRHLNVRHVNCTKMEFRGIIEVTSAEETQI